MRLGYVPYDRSLHAPGDRRRFVAWAQERKVDFEVVDRPQRGIDVAVVCTVADLARWVDAPHDIKVVYDLTDDYLALTDRGFKNRARGIAKFLSGELSRPTLRYRGLLAAMCRRADLVVVTSGQQLRHVRELVEPQRVRLILDCYDEQAVGRKRDYGAARPPRLVWEGLPFNVGTLGLVGDALRNLAPELRPELHIVTPPTFRPYARRFGRRSTLPIARAALGNVPIVLHDWGRETVFADVAACDVAVIPLPLDDRFAAGNAAQKLINLWAMGMPTVTTATPAYEEAMADAGLDLACRTTADWERALRNLLTDEKSRRE